MNKPDKIIHVVAAVLIHEKSNSQKVFATQRGYGEYKDWWEFPGGKVEPGETNQEALKREIREELSAAITVGDLLHVVEYDYPAFHLTMHCYLCSLETDSITLNEHEAAKWLPIDDLWQVNWLPADVQVVKAIEARRQ